MMSSDGGETDSGRGRHDRFSIERRDSGPTMVAPRERAKREVENGFAQFDLLLEMINDGLKARESKSFRLRVSMLNKLNRAAVNGLVERPGSYRVGEMEIQNSGHRPPPPEEVDEYMDQMCEWVNDNFGRSALELAAYVMWRVNWIHPYSDGNGRTARAASYLITCIRRVRCCQGELPCRLWSNKRWRRLPARRASRNTTLPSRPPIVHVSREISTYRR